MKKNSVERLKQICLDLLIGIIFAGGGAYAATNYAITSSDISYTDNSSLGVTNVQAAIDGTCTKFSTQLTSLKQEVINEMYPVGSVYLSTSLSTASDVAAKLGGTWVAYGQGRTLVGVGSNGTTTYAANSSGGKSTATLSITNLPNHTHTTGSSNITNVQVSETSSQWYVNETSSATGTEFSGTNTASTNSVLSEAPYGAGSFYFWKVLYTNKHTHTVTATVPSLTTNTCTNCSGTSFSVQDPYIVVYMYKRTA